MGDFDSFIKLTNKEDVIASLKALEGDIQANVIKAMSAGGKEIKKQLKAEIGHSAKGEPSTPGSAPHRLTGELRNSVYAKVEPPMLGEPITLKVSIRAFFGRMLEFGTSKMAARPFFYTGVARAVPALFGKVREALAAEIRRRNSGLHQKNARRRSWTSAMLQGAIERDYDKLDDFDNSKPAGE